MTQRVESMISLARRGSSRYDADEVREAVDFLAWLLRGNFVLLGAREYEIKDDAYRCIPGSGLGILADEERSAYSTPVPLSELPEALRNLALGGELLIVDKANARAPVHRRERMDYVGVRRVTPDGELAGEARLLGLFTTKAYQEAASETPVLHRKLRRVLEAEDLIEGSHDYKAAVALFDAFPKDELFAAPVDDLRRAVVALLALEGTDRVRLLGRRAADGRSASFILALPRERYRALLVERVTQAVQAPLQGARRRGPAHARRGHARARALPGARAGRAAGRRQRGARARGRPARAHVGRRAARRAGRALRRRARAAAVVDLGHVPAGALQGLHGAGDGGDRHRAARAAGRGRAVPRLAAAAREAHARRALHARPEGRAGRRAADARGPRAARDRGDLDAADRRRRDVGAGVPRARPGRRAARPRDARRARGRAAGRRPPRRRRDRQPQPAGDHRRARPPPGGDPARVPQVPPARRLALHRELPERRAGRELRGHGQARALLRAALRSGAGDRRGGRGRAARRDPAPTSTRSPRSTTTASCATSWR